jgi:hypothetical protein
MISTLPPEKDDGPPKGKRPLTREGCCNSCDFYVEGRTTSLQSCRSTGEADAIRLYNGSTQEAFTDASRKSFLDWSARQYEHNLYVLFGRPFLYLICWKTRNKEKMKTE